MYEYTQSRVDVFQGKVDAEADKVDGWFADKLEWADKLYDSYYKEHLINELNHKRDSTLASLQARRDASQADADASHAAMQVAF
jgi:hypothetical protein